MGEEVRITEYDGGGIGGGEEDRVTEFEDGLPSTNDLTPLSQQLISPELASAFRILPEPYRTLTDVNRASRNTLSSLHEDEVTTLECSDSRKLRKIIEEGEVVANGIEEAESGNANSTNKNDFVFDDSSGATKTTKRARLVWTPQLHKRFIDVVAHLGIKNAVPKTIMQLMNVEGLTRENVASHLQKYRLYLKRMRDGPGPVPGPADHLFSTSHVVPQNSHDSLRRQQDTNNGHLGMASPFPASQKVAMPMLHGFNMVKE